MANVIKNVWDKITIYCTNHNDPVKMQVYSNSEHITTPHIVCQHEHPCSNRLNLHDYQDLCIQIMELIHEDPFADLKNTRFKFRGGKENYMINILKHSDNELRIGIFNTTVLGK